MIIKQYDKYSFTGNIPADFRNYRVIEWDKLVSTNVFQGIDKEKIEISKYYLVQKVKSNNNGRNHELNLFEVYCLDGNQKSVEKCEVINKLQKDAIEPTLRITEYGLQIEDSQDIMSYQEIAQLKDFQVHIIKKFNINFFNLLRR